MSEDIENQLRRALRPVEPSAGFAERVMRALPERAPRPALAPVTVLRPAQRPTPWRTLSAPTALAASLLVAVLVGQQVGERVGTEQALREQRAGLAARAELMQALRITSRKLDLAYQAVNRPATAPPPAEENRS
jgi:hypothetical protein